MITDGTLYDRGFRVTPHPFSGRGILDFPPTFGY